MMNVEGGIRKGGEAAIWLAAVGGMLFFYAVAILLGSLNQDEGWYLYAGGLVSQGKLPFIDFASTQGPLMALIYALAQPLVKLWGVAGGRVFTALMGVATVAVAMRLAYNMTLARREPDAAEGRAAGRTAALLTLAFLGLNLYQVYFTSIVKTYSAAGLLTVLGFLFLQRALYGGWQRGKVFGLSCAASALFALAAGIRLSAGILLPAIWLVLAVRWLRSGRRSEVGAAVAGFLAGGSLVLPAIYLPFILAAPTAVKFGLLEYHSGREIGSAFVLLAYKGGFLLRLAGSYFVLVCAAVAAGMVLLSGRREGRRSRTQGDGGAVLLLIGVAAVTAVHLAAAFPYDDYQVFIMPVVAAVFAAMLAPVVKRARYAVAAVLLLAAVQSVSSPMLQSWLLAPRDRIWWPLRQATALKVLKQAADQVRIYGGFKRGECGTLLTQDTYLAVEAGLGVPSGMELGPFCYFPEMARDRAEACHVLNREMMLATLRDCRAPVAAFSGYGLSIKCPEVSRLSMAEQAELWRAVDAGYIGVTNISKFGQADTTLRILKCREQK